MNFSGFTGPHEKWTACNPADFADELPGDCLVDRSVLRAALGDRIVEGEARAIRQSDTPCGF